MIDPLIQLERVTADFRRGLPVIIENTENTQSATLTISAETIDSDGLEGLRTFGNSHLLLTHNRARTLKIRLYTPELVALPVPPGRDVAWVQRIADPAFDLDQPLQGPFDASRDPPTQSALAAVALAKLSGLLPAALSVHLDHATMANVPEGYRSNILKIPAVDILSYDGFAAAALRPVTTAHVPLADSEETQLFAFRPADGGPEHIAIVIGEPSQYDAPLVRLHSECFTGDLIGSLKCDCGDQLRGAIKTIAEEGAGVVLYLAQEGRGIGLMNKLRAYALQDKGFDTVEANERLGFEVDERLFSQARSMLKHLGISKVRLLTNNPDKVQSLSKFGIHVTERVPHHFPSNEHNWRYLDTKKKKTGHLL